MLSVIITYNNIDGLHELCSTPQYGFNWEMKEFEQSGYNATASELRDNLIGMNATVMLYKTWSTSDVYKNILSYLMFLNKKRTGVVKARACANGRPQ